MPDRPPVFDDREDAVLTDAVAALVESERALRIFTEVGDPWGTGIASQLRSEWLILAGRLQEALAVSD
ncbi:hypothetical protein ABTH81_20045, partial [Acinetobacter baumannii]